MHQTPKIAFRGSESGSVVLKGHPLRDLTPLRPPRGCPPRRLPQRRRRAAPALPPSSTQTPARLLRCRVPQRRRRHSRHAAAFLNEDAEQLLQALFPQRSAGAAAARQPPLTEAPARPLRLALPQRRRPAATQRQRTKPPEMVRNLVRKNSNALIINVFCGDGRTKTPIKLRKTAK